MITGLTVVVIGIAVVTAIWGAVSTIIGKPPGNLLFYCALLAELGVLVQTVGGFISIARGHGPDELATSIAYLAAVVLLMPAAIWWAVSDRSRYSGLVMTVAGVAIAVMSFRLLELWGALGG
jgi:hypothetical protein